MRRIALLVASTAVVIFGVAPGLAASSNQNAGEESQAAADAADWFTSQRLAPNGAIDPNAFASATLQAASLPSVAGTWTERTNLAGADGNDFSDPPAYIDPTSNFSNSGAGDRWVAGRMTSLAAVPNGPLFAGAADGGVWKSTDGGQQWAPVFDSQGTLSIGALLVTGSGGSYTVYAGTGEANTSSDSYAGIGVLASTDGGSTWNRVGGDALNGALIFRLVQDSGNILAATSHGLFSFDGTSWTSVLHPACDPALCKGNINLKVGNMITDVQVKPGTGGSQVLAVAGWRGGAPTNGLYLSTDGGAHFAFIANPQGWVPAKDEGRTTIVFSAAGDRAYAIVQSPYLFNVGTNGKTLLQGVYASNNGDPNGPWTKIADSEKLQSSGSAQAINRIGKGYGPGIQAWYNQFLAVDPANKDHLYLGLEEVYETQNGGAGWNTIAPYWNFGFKCFSYTPFEGTCDHNGAHPDQHAALITGGKLYVGNDGGVYSRTLTDHATGHWTNNNAHMDALQYYGAQGSGDSIIYGGLQDNGSAKVFTTPTMIQDDRGNPINVSSVQVFGGDGGYTIVDPKHSDNVITEYVGLTALQSSDGGKNWHFINPPDPDPRFIAPIDMDRTNSDHLVAGGAIVWNSESGVAGTNTVAAWQNIFDVRTSPSDNPSTQPSQQVSALDAVTIEGVQYVAAAWCGPCNVSFASGGGFHSGLVILSNAGGTWKAITQACTGTTAPCAAGLPKRYISGIKIDTSNPSHAFLSLSGYSRKWMIGPSDAAGVGHVFETSNGGATWADVSGNLPDAPMDDIVFNNGKLVVAADFGVFVSSDGGATWSHLGTNLPNVVVDQLTVDPNGQIVAATHGRGVWTIAAP
jgi:photosystem II stability/assembly factor-like uncharacterized protein